MRHHEKLKQQLADDATREEALTVIAEFVKQTCLMNGTTVGTAYTVAGAFAQGLEAEWKGDQPNG